MLAVLTFDRPTPAGSNRVDHHQVGEREPGIWIVAQGRTRYVMLVLSEIENARADEAKVQKGGCRARSAVENECQRTVCSGALCNISGVEYRNALLARLIVERQRAGGRCVGKLSAGCIDRMLGDGVGRQQPQYAFRRLPPFGDSLFAGRLPRALAGVLCACGVERAGQDDRQREAVKEGKGHRRAAPVMPPQLSGVTAA